ncbi:hypothetical protein [Sphingobium yanoikuyae]|jgi:hypothetical protein|uniref:hypothetical protein n=1 Tax=Sphingobium yanoikuyae TaxID=13690 RepID=UPI0031D4382F
MTKPVILVAGLGRCGSSLVMQMLSAADVQTIGTYPAFEDRVTAELPAIDAQREFFARCPGHAVKLLDPHLHQPPIGLSYRTIFLTRHPAEQAKSMLKLIGERSDRRARRAMEHSVRRDTGRAREAVIRIGDGRFYNMPFEHLIHDPLGAAEAIAKWVWNGRDELLDIEKMARCVRRRPATCLPYMLEMELLPHG